MSSYRTKDGRSIPTLSGHESLPLAPVQGPDETVRSATGSGALVQVPRNVARVGHAPSVIGNANVAGAPSNYVAALPSWEVPESSTVKRGRNKKGATALVQRHGRVVHDVIDDNRDARVDALMSPHEHQRMSDAAIARWATEWARGECSVCEAFWNACDEHEHDTESSDYVDHCSACVGKCDCMAPVLGGQTVAYAEVIHAGDGAVCAVAQRHGSLADACNGMPIAVGRTIRDNYVPEQRTDGASVVTRDESKLAWPTRYALPMPSWRASESSVWHGTTISAYVEHGAPVDACAYADARVMALPSPCDVTYRDEAGPIESAPYFHGHHATTGRGQTATAKRASVRVAELADIESARAALARVNDSALKVGATEVVKVGSMMVAIHRNGVARYTITHGKRRTYARTYTLASRAVARLTA